MGSNWPLVRIEDIQADKKGAIAIGPFGSRMKSDCYVESGIPVIRGTNLGESPMFKNDFVHISEEKADSLGSCNVFKDDLVFPHRGSIGEVGIINDDKRYVISSSLMKLTCDKSKVRPKFLYYFFKSLEGKHELLKNASQVGTPGIGQPLTSLKSIEFRNPPLSIQDKIISHIEGLNNKIELNQQTNQTLEQMAQTLFKSWFVDFAPVFDNLLAKLDFDLTKLPSDFPDVLQKRAQKRLLVLNSEVGAVTKIKAKEKAKSHVESNATASLQNDSSNTSTTDLTVNIHQHFPSEFEHNEQLGWIPKGWEVSALSELINIKHGFAYKGEFFSDEKTEDILLTPGNVCVGGGFKSAKYKYYNGPVVEEYIFKEGDVYLNMTDLSKASDTLGYPAVVPEIDGITFHHNQRLGKVIYKEHNSAKKEFLYQVLCSPKSRNNVLASATGTTVKHTSPTKILSLLICHSGGCIESMFENHAKALYEKTAANNLNSIGLTKLRDTLLPKLISGELQIPDVKTV